MRISAADQFVIAASQMLIVASAARLSFEDVERRLESLRGILQQSNQSSSAGRAGESVAAASPTSLEG
jgi:hypothetical protein